MTASTLIRSTCQRSGVLRMIVHISELLPILSTKVQRKRRSFPTVRFCLIFSLRSSCVFSYVCYACSDCLPSLSSLRKTFGWKSLAINLVGYLLFVFPLTGFAVYSRANERILCGVNETIPRKVTILFFFCLF